MLETMLVITLVLVDLLLALVLVLLTYGLVLQRRQQAKKAADRAKAAAELKALADLVFKYTEPKSGPKVGANPFDS